MAKSRLLSPDDAAVYLGLGSRWAIYRLIAQGAVPALRLAGKLRLDRDDLDLLIARLKTPSAEDHKQRVVTTSTPATLAPLRSRRVRASVTVSVTAPQHGRKVPGRAALMAPAERTSECSSERRRLIDSKCDVGVRASQADG
jgi:excisionase family DNA binding protein